MVSPLTLQDRQHAVSVLQPLVEAMASVFDLPSPAIIAQACLESRWLTSLLARKYFNVFGRKARKGEPYVVLSSAEGTDAVSLVRRSRWKIYPNYSQGLLDYGHWITAGRHVGSGSLIYQKALDVRTDPIAYAYALQGVWAADAHYGDKIVAIMQEFHLLGASQ